MRVARFFSVAPMLAALVRAQAPTHTVSGVVFDSIVGAPLVGALVQARSPDASSTVFTALTDGEGRYRLAGLPDGRFAIGFQHRSLNAIGLDSPVDAFELGSGESITRDLAIPSGAALRAARCGDGADATDGMLVGSIGNVGYGSPGAKTSISVEWVEVMRDSGTFRSVPRRTSGIIADDGSYYLCAVPSDLWLTTRVMSPGHHSIDGLTSVPPGGARRFDFQLVETGVTRGTATLTGLVVREDHARLASGRASIPSLSVDVEIKDGVYTIPALPAGTWLVETRAIGFEPHSSLVQLVDHATTADTIIITRKVQTLEAVSVIGKVGRDIKVLDGVAERHRIANGTVFLRGNEFLDHAMDVSDVLRAAKGFGLKGVPRGCGPGAVGTGRNSKRGLAIYVDGMRVTDLATMNKMVPVADVLAVETYGDVTSAPFLWRTNDACAVMAVWTRQ